MVQVHVAPLAGLSLLAHPSTSWGDPLCGVPAARGGSAVRPVLQPTSASGQRRSGEAGLAERGRAALVLLGEAASLIGRARGA
jgi:hypothetical protein